MVNRAIHCAHRLLLAEVKRARKANNKNRVTYSMEKKHIAQPMIGEAQCSPQKTGYLPGLHSTLCFLGGSASVAAPARFAFIDDVTG